MKKVLGCSRKGICPNFSTSHSNPFQLYINVKKKKKDPISCYVIMKKTVKSIVGEMTGKAVMMKHINVS
jgi:hypothetical protein